MSPNEWKIITDFLVPMWSFSIATMVLGVLCSVFFGLAAYNDAKAHGSTDGVMWGLLIGFFGLIPGIIYLCIRKKPAQKQVFCPQCYSAYWISSPTCPRCGIPNPASYPFYDPQIPEYKKRAKRDLILGIVFAATVLVLTIVIFCWMIFWVTNMAVQLH